MLRSSFTKGERKKKRKTGRCFDQQVAKFQTKQNAKRGSGTKLLGNLGFCAGGEIMIMSGRAKTNKTPKKVLTKSFLFSVLESKDLGVVVDAMRECVGEPNTKLINQGQAVLDI